ncbi:MAG: hypothetical protein IBX40_10000 [Methanosarcinales archaeon]|nr:hypothetical protein [Methanosarcinales archaeon]
MCIRKENLGKIVIASIAILVISQVIHTIGAVLTMDYYTDEAYAQVWSKIMMPAIGPPPMSFYIISMFSAFVFALIFVSVYDIFEASVPGKTWKKKGVYYGLIIFLLSSQSYMAMSYLINLPCAILLDYFPTIAIMDSNSLFLL